MPAIILSGSKVDVDFPTNLERFGQLSQRQRSSAPVQIILHHDVCASAVSCFNALKGRGLGTHFCVDNDGTVFQFVDPGTHMTSHAAGYIQRNGQRERVGFNAQSIGIDISNLVLPKYAAKYTPPRPEATIPIHGKPVQGLLPYPVQIENAMKLLKMLVDHFGISTQHQAEPAWSGIITPTTPGIYGHMQISPQKIDPFGFPFGRLSELK